MPSPAAKAKPQAPTLKEADVLAWLAKRPQFFQKHSEQLAHLSLPKKGGNILSLHAAKAEKVQKSADKISLTHQRLLTRAEENSLIAEQIFTCALALIGATTLPALRKAVQTTLAEQLSLNATRLILAGPESATTLPAEEIEALCTGGTVTLRNLPDAAARAMYGPKGKLIASDCLLHLTHNGTTYGLLAMGSTDAARFHAGQSTHMATFLAKVLGTCLARLS